MKGWFGNSQKHSMASKGVRVSDHTGGDRRVPAKYVNKEGEWECPACKFINMPNRDVCVNCGEGYIEKEDIEVKKRLTASYLMNKYPDFVIVRPVYEGKNQPRWMVIHVPTKSKYSGELHDLEVAESVINKFIENPIIDRFTSFRKIDIDGIKQQIEHNKELGRYDLADDYIKMYGSIM